MITISGLMALSVVPPHAKLLHFLFKSFFIFLIEPFLPVPYLSVSFFIILSLSRLLPSVFPLSRLPWPRNAPKPELPHTSLNYCVIICGLSSEFCAIPDSGSLFSLVAIFHILFTYFRFFSGLEWDSLSALEFHSSVQSNLVQHILY